MVLLVGPPALMVTRAAPPPAEDCFQDPVLGRALLSPDGRRVAMRVGNKGVRARLAVLEVDTLKPTIVATYAGADVQQFRARPLRWATQTPNASASPARRTVTIRP